MRTTVPRKFERALVESTTLEDLPEAMRNRYPHLTPKEHEWRDRIANHEAGHLMTALVLSLKHAAYFGTRAFVRVPGRTPSTDQYGTDGEIQCQMGTWRTKALVTAGGIVADALTYGTAFAQAQLRLGKYDGDADRIREYVKHQCETTGRTSKVETQQLLRGARDVIRSSRVPLEKLAIALLLHGDRAGVVKCKQLDGLREYFSLRCAGLPC